MEEKLTELFNDLVGCIDYSPDQTRYNFEEVAKKYGLEVDVNKYLK